MPDGNQELLATPCSHWVTGLGKALSGLALLTVSASSSGTASGLACHTRSDCPGVSRRSQGCRRERERAVVAMVAAARALVAPMRRHEAWVARLHPNQGAAVGKVRLVVIQADPLTQAGLATLLVVPLTTRHRPAAEPLRVPIRARDRLLRDGYPMADQPRALDRARIGEGPPAMPSGAGLDARSRGSGRNGRGGGGNPLRAMTMPHPGVGVSHPRQRVSERVQDALQDSTRRFGCTPAVAPVNTCTG